MTDLSALPPLRDVIARYELRTRKALGQHFLCDLNLTRRIAEVAGDLSGCTVFEIGSGPGGLTRALVESDAKRVVAIEKDPRCVKALEDLVAASEGKLEVIAGDALKTDLPKLAAAPRAIVANLPYNIGTELLLGWLKNMTQYRSLTLMFQSEVVDRLCAAPGSKAYGRLSVIAQFCSDVTRVLDVPAAAFTPPPKVSSAVAHLTPRKDRPADIDFATMEKVTAFAFGQRRKMLRSSLKPLGGEALLNRAGIDPTRRAETLSLEEFEMLARLTAGIVT
ncbi:MAG: 16S rRNA (adenine(1518)-N(6)/adenine(1519)-N(6))-dimethyltransferase RsmA [Alphaproteobacteria bacterium]|nr:16S rRNA (adenine(1518)-N(6)/adenine(1519)-N(6))-dimethyltransferase RsmA [Alphaproteobacteria bacterium]